MEQVRHNHGKLRAAVENGCSTHQQSATTGNTLRLFRRITYRLRQQLDRRSVARFAPDEVQARVKIYAHKRPETKPSRVRPFMDRCAGYADAHIRGYQRESNGFHRNFLNDARLSSSCDASSHNLVERDSVKLTRKAQNRVGRKVSHADLELIAQRMARGHDGQAVKRAYALGNQPRIAHISLNQGEVNLSGAQVLKHLATAGHDLDDYLDVIRHIAEGRERLTHEAQLSGKAGHADPDGSRPPSRVTGQMRLGVRDTLQNWAGMPEQYFARRQQLGTARQPQEKRQPKLFFQLMDSPGQGGLRDVEHIGRALKTTFLSNSNKIMKPSKIHTTLHSSKHCLQ